MLKIFSNQDFNNKLSKKALKNKYKEKNRKIAMVVLKDF